MRVRLVPPVNAAERLASTLDPPVMCLPSSCRSNLHRQPRPRHLHSSSLSKYFANIYYKKICPTCQKPNILPLDRCTFCDTKLTDQHITRGGKEIIHDAMLKRGPAAAASRPGASSATAVGSGRARPAFIDGELDGPDGQLVEYYRSYEVLVVRYPYPTAQFHLCALSKDTMYDIRSLRKNDLKLLRRMVREGYRSLTTAIMQHTKRPISPQLVEQFAVVGCNYPNEFNQVLLHLIFPPIDRYAMFAKPFFYPIRKIVSDIESWGQVQPYRPADVLQQRSHDPVLSKIQECDRAVRRELPGWGSAGTHQRPTDVQGEGRLE